MTPKHTHEPPEPIPAPGDAAAPATRGMPQPYPPEIDEELEYTSPPGRDAPPIRMLIVVRGRGKPLVYEGPEIDCDAESDGEL